MAAVNPVDKGGGGDDAAGGDFAGESFESPRGGPYCMDSRIGISNAGAKSNVGAAAQASPEMRAATAFATAIVASPSKSSHRWASSFGGGIDFDDEVWDIRFHFTGEDNLERTLTRSDITVLNLLALVEQCGYGIRDYMYYVKGKGKGKKGMEVVDSMSKVDKMLELYDSEKVLNLTVVKHKAEWPVGLNREETEAKNLLDEPVVLSVDKAGVNFMAEEDEEVFPVAIDYTDEDEEEMEDVNVSDDEDFYYDGEYRVDLRAAERKAAIAAELELIQKLKKQRQADNPENKEIMEKLNRMKEQRADPFLHFEGDTDVEEMYEPEEESEVEEIAEPEYSEKKKPTRCGPTSSSHHELVEFEGSYFMPSSNEDSSPDELGDKGCPFYMSASKIAHEQTFCIRKVLGLHTCIAHGENTKVTIDWFSKQSDQAVRTDPNTTVDTLIDNAKQKWGVQIPKSKSYRARKIAFSVVMGDQKAQYTRLRDYLQAVIDTNPGSSAPSRQFLAISL
ncbi:hypothetical protein ACQ4PT_018170 [Festuca glaucescens]